MRTRKCSPSFTVIALALLILFLFPALAFSEETYVFERMWPTLQQPWYFCTPDGVAVDANGTIYIADTCNQRVQKFTSDGQLINKWEQSGLSAPIGIAIGPTGHIYVIDAHSSSIREFMPDGQFVNSWGSTGSGDGEFQFAGSLISDKDILTIRYGGGIAIDASGNVYISDLGNHRIQKFTSDGRFLTKWGTHGSGDGQFDRPNGIAVDRDGNVYVADTLNQRIQKFTSEGAFIRKWGSFGSGNGQFKFMSDDFTVANHGGKVAIDGSGNVYVADTMNNRIQKFTSDGQYLGKWNIDQDIASPFPKGIAFDASGNMFVVNANSLVRLNPSGQITGIFTNRGSGNGQFKGTSGIAADQNSNIYVLDSSNFRIQKFTSDGQFITKWGQPGSSDGEFMTSIIEPGTRIADGGKIASDTSGYIYLSDLGNHRIQKFTSNGQFIAKWGTQGSGDGQFDIPKGIAVDGNGNVYVADLGNSRIQKFTSNGKFITKWGHYGSGDGEFNFKKDYWVHGDLAVDGSGNVYVADHGNNRIQKFTSDGQFITKWGKSGSGEGEFHGPWDIYAGRDGYVYVVQDTVNPIQKFTSDGQFVGTIGTYGSDPGQFRQAYSLCIAPNNKLYATDGINNRVQVFSFGGPSPVTGISKAIIVAGGGPFAGNNLWDATQMCANYAYRTLTYQGYTKDTIYYLTSDTKLDLDGNGILDDVDADATNSNLRDAIAIWAKDAQNLFIYMVDHGGNGTFRMGATELLYATDLDAWLDQIQQTIPGKVVLVYDACRSGSFLANLAPPSGKERILTTSTSADQEAIFASQGTISFSFLFWGRIFNGDSFYDSFYQAMNSIGVTYHQSPQIDANGNGIGNEQADLAAARTLKIGNETKSAGDIPYIGSVSPAQTLYGQASAKIFAASVTDADGIGRVWAVITPPGYSSADPDTPMTDLPMLELPSTGGSRYEGTYNSFATSGTYNIAVYAMDGGAVISLPKTTTVSQGASVSLLYYPHVDTTLGWETEIAAINTGTRQAACTFNGYSGEGGLVESKSITLNAKGRSEMTVSQAFTNHGSIRYFILSSDTGTIKGYTKFYQIGQHRVAIPAVSEINTSDIYVSHIASDTDWWTGIGLLNTTASAKSVTMEFNTGETKDIELSANQHKAFMIETLFGQSRPDIQSARITHAEGIIGLELFGSIGGVSRLEGIPLTDDTTTTLYYPHVDSNGWWTGVVAYNPSETGCDITITPYSAGGAVLAASTLPIAGKEKYVGLVSALGLPTETAWFRIDSTLPLSGFELFCTLPDEGRLGAYARMGSAGGTEGVFAKIEKEGWTGIAFVNAGEAAAVVTLIAYDDSGVKRAVSSILLNPHAKVVDLAENLFLQDITGATYITYSSDQNVVGFQLNGSADGTMLDGLPGM